jgi:hypothetical protein
LRGVTIDPNTGRPGWAGYAKRLRELGSFQSGIRGTWAKQFLDERVVDAEGNVTIVFKCIGTIWPERNAHRNTELDLGHPKDEEGGRITAKVLIEDNPHEERDCAGYGDFPMGVSYIWVENLEATANPDSAKATAIIIAEDGTQIIEKEISVCRHPQYGYRHAHARWMFDDQDVRAWWTCEENGCCNLP